LNNEQALKVAGKEIERNAKAMECGLASKTFFMSEI
jgi:hypothetical protein